MERGDLGISRSPRRWLPEAFRKRVAIPQQTLGDETSCLTDLVRGAGCGVGAPRAAAPALRAQHDAHWRRVGEDHDQYVIVQIGVVVLACWAGPEGPVGCCHAGDSVGALPARKVPQRTVASVGPVSARPPLTGGCRQRMNSVWIRVTVYPNGSGAGPMTCQECSRQPTWVICVNAVSQPPSVRANG